MKDSKRKDLVEAEAHKLCADLNRLSTKRLKIVMRNKYPNQTWNKYHDGVNKGVSDYFHELVSEGKFVSIADNGTYQTYADVTIAIPSRKGDTYIHDNEPELITSPVSLLNNLVGAIKRKVAKKATKKADTDYGISVASLAAQALANLSTSGFTKKAAPKKAKVLVKKSLTNMQKLTKNATKVEIINRSQAYDMLSTAGGKFGSALFLDKKNDERVMNFQVVSTGKSHLGYITVTDTNLKKKNPDDCIRQINLQTLQLLKLNKRVMKVK